MSNPVSILGGDLTSPQGRQVLQDALDTLYGLIQKAGGTAAGPTTFDELRVRMLTVLGTIDVVPEDKPPANVNSRLVTPWLTGQRGRGQVWRFEDQQDGGNLLEVRSQPYLIGTPTATAGDWEFRFYSAQRDPAGAYRSLGAIRFGSDGRIRTYDASEVVQFDSTVTSSSPLTTKGDLYGHDGSADVRIAGGSDWKIPTYLASAASGVSPQTIDDHLNQLPNAADANKVLTTDGSTRSYESLATLLTAEGIDFSTGATTGRAPVTQEYEAKPGVATATYTPTEPLGSGQTWRITVYGDATGGTAYVKYDGASGTTLTTATGTNPFCMQAFIAYKTTTSVECTGFFASDGGTTILTPTITSTTLSKQIAVSAGTGGTISKWIIERIGDTASGTAGGGGGSALAAWLPTPVISYDSQDSVSITLSGSNVTDWAQGTLTAPSAVSQGTATNQPTYSADIGDGYPGIAFDGVDNYLFNSTPVATANSADLWIVAQVDTLSVAHTLVAWSNSTTTNNYVVVYVNTSGQIEFYQSNGATADGGTTPSGGIVAGQTHLIRVVCNGATNGWQFWIDGVQQTLTITSGTHTGDWVADCSGINRFSFGALIRSSGVINYMDGYLRQVLCYEVTTATRILMPDHAAHLYAYFRARWPMLA